VRVLNTARPTDPGSLITTESDPSPEGWRVKSIASKKAITAVTIASTRMLLAHGFLARVFEVFGRHHVVVDLVDDIRSVHLGDRGRHVAIVRSGGRAGINRRRRGAHRARGGGVVGEGAPTQVGLAGHVFTLLGGVGVPVR